MTTKTSRRTQVKASITPEAEGELQKIAASLEISVSAVVRRAITEYLQRAA
jgi:hypothetical protein